MIDKIALPKNIKRSLEDGDIDIEYARTFFTQLLTDLKPISRQILTDYPDMTREDFGKKMNVHFDQAVKNRHKRNVAVLTKIQTDPEAMEKVSNYVWERINA